MLLGGAATVDITPKPGLLMTGYAARTQPASGAHDSLTVRAIVINNTALVVCDVIGMHEDMSLQIRQRACLPTENIVVSALHNHGAPASMVGRLGEQACANFLEQLESACVEAIALALERAKPCQLRAGYGEQPGIAINRRHQNGVVDDTLPVLALIDENDKTIATVVSYACHPVVLGADNLSYTADYPHYVRQALEKKLPGSVALFLTGAAGDANTGHSAKDSISLVADPKRTFDEAQRIGEHIAHCALAAELSDVGTAVSITSSHVPLLFERRETRTAFELADNWRQQMKTATSAQKVLLQHWIHWAENIAPTPLTPWIARVSIVRWGNVYFIALPGEIFASTAHSVRGLLGDIADSGIPTFIAGYSDGNPGYIPPDEEFVFGGYEIDEAHRYYGMVATFAPGSVDRLLCAITECLEH